MSQFDWRTEDDASWREPPKPLPPDPRKRPWGVIVFILLVLLAAGFVVYRQLDRQIDAATTAVQTDVLATHNLVQTAVSRSDLELFRSQLSGRDPAWTETQESLLADELIQGREFWGWQQPNFSPPLTLADLTAVSGPLALTLAPDLNSAELQFPLTYLVTKADGVTETITLAQTAVYRRGKNRWLLAPPEEAFWDGWVTNRGDLLTLIYPQRDRLVAEQLAADLEVMLRQLCETFPDLACPDDLHISLRLDADPAIVLTATDWETFLDGGLTLHLPAPTLMGQPVDQAGYDALYRAYGAQVATAVIADRIGWQCCHHAPFFQVLVDAMLRQMDLRPWPVTDADHARVLRESVGTADLNAYWEQTDWQEWPQGDGWELYTAVDFLLQAYPDIGPMVWLRELQSNRSIVSWLNQALYGGQGATLGAGPAVLEALDEKWWQFAYAQTLLAQQQMPRPLPFPGQDLQLSCLTDQNYDDNTMTAVRHYNLQQETWTNVLSRTGYLLTTPLLDDSGWVVQAFPFVDNAAQVAEIWRNGQPTPIHSEESMSLTLGQFDPHGRYLINYVFNPDVDRPIPTLIDLDHCTADDCAPIELSAQPYWSPDSQATILTTSDVFADGALFINGRMMLFDSALSPAAAPLRLGDAQGRLQTPDEPPFGEGYSPFWLNEQQLGYVRPGAPETGDEVVLLSLPDMTAQTVLTLADLQATMPKGLYTPASIRYVLTHPQQPGLLFVVALDALGREGYVFSYDWQAGDLVLRLQSQVRPFHALGFSPDGRWLALTGSDNNEYRADSTTGILYVHNIAANETQTYISQFANFVLSPQYDWSADGRWLLFVVDDRILSLVAPDYHYQWVFAHDQRNCSSMNWINRQPIRSEP